MSKQIKVSIITAVYNGAVTIGDAMLSLKKQSYLSIENVVVDGSSVDKTVSIVEDFSQGATVLISEPDDGIYDALNKGISVASGDVIGFLHSDDLFFDEYVIRDVVLAFEKYQCDVVYGDLVYVSKDNPDNVIRYWKSGTFKHWKMFFGWMPPHPTLFMRRELYMKYGAFDTKFKISADYDSLVRYLWKNHLNVIYIPRVLTKMRVGGVSNRSLTNILIKMKEDVQVMKRHHLCWPVTLFFKNFFKIPQFFFKFW